MIYLEKFVTCFDVLGKPCKESALVQHLKYSDQCPYLSRQLWHFVSCSSSEFSEKHFFLTEAFLAFFRFKSVPIVVRLLLSMTTFCLLFGILINYPKEFTITGNSFKKALKRPRKHKEVKGIYKKKKKFKSGILG